METRVTIAHSKQSVAAEVIPVGNDDLVTWQREIQRYVTPGTIGADWHWPTLLDGWSMIEFSRRRRARAFQIQVEGPDGVALPVAQALMSLGYYFPASPKLRCVFLWYLASAPTVALAKFGYTTRLAVLSSVIDAAIQISLEKGYEGRIGLHAAHGTTAEQSEALAQRYRECGLSSVPRQRKYLSYPFRPQDGRLFYLDSASARAWTLRHNVAV